MSHNHKIQHGREKEFEHDDPMELRAVAMPGGSEEAQARAFIEEFLFMGMSRSELIEIFKNPFYTGAYRLYEKFGKEKIIMFIDDYFRTNRNKIGNRKSER